MTVIDKTVKPTVTFLERQSLLLLKNSRLALCYIAILTCLSLTTWVAATIIALITLRKGWQDGFGGLILSSLLLCCLSQNSHSLSFVVIMTIITFLPCYLTAIVLRYTASWCLAGEAIIGQGLLGIILIYWLAPEFIQEQYQIINKTLLSLGYNNLADLLANSVSANTAILASYIFGIQIAINILSAIISLLVARSMQAKLFCPGAFKEEIINWSGSKVGLLLFVVMAIYAYQYNLIAISSLPLFIVYYCSIGVGLFLIIFNNKTFGLLLLLLIPLIIFPFIMLPIYVICGIIDSLFNLRCYFKHLSS